MDASVYVAASQPSSTGLSWLLQAKTGAPAKLTKPIVSHIFHPVRPYFGIDAKWTAQNDAWMFGEEARGARARALAHNAGTSSTACQDLAVAAAELALAEATHDLSDEAGGVDECVVPRSTACLFTRGRNDPVLEPQYVDAYYAYLKARTTVRMTAELPRTASLLLLLPSRRLSHGSSARSLISLCQASVEWHLFERAQHAMAVVEAPEQYKAQHVEYLLSQVPEWAGRK